MMFDFSEKFEDYDYHNVVAKPVQFAIDMKDQPMEITYPPPGLHMTTGEAGHIVADGDKIDAKAMKDWLYAVGVRRDRKHGHSSFKGL